MSDILEFPTNFVRDVDLREYYAFAKEVNVPDCLIKEWKNDLRLGIKNSIEFAVFLETFAEAVSTR